ncbi:MAG TPA: CesT family type III secretion system chaperone [Methylibium sp.]|uniref:CesT family type III secretion system chaperone n=1 Tax=Methylibium sp. TaxID=2067992 RepID=UPI002DB83CB4|nr:CesT family type III secretion system chaperone [Methylibium sp.]HEU4459597.1 CesT family type III secretion system chaperone [Methylibium sp.]
MNHQRYQELIRETCEAVGLPDTRAIVERGALEVEGYEIQLLNYETDPSAIYMNFVFGVVPAGRSLAIWRMMLEANLSVYAQDQAHLGMDADTGSVLLIVRLVMVQNVDGQHLAEVISHYVEHGRYWKNTILNTNDEMFEGVCSGDYRWIKG